MLTIWGVGFGLGVWRSWYGRLWHGPPARSRAVVAVRVLLSLLPIVLLAALVLVLATAAAREVRESSLYIVFFTVMGAVWLTGTTQVLAWLGIGAIDDAIERQNVAAGVAVAGALCAGMVIFAFSNVGEGASIWTTLGPAALGFVSCTALWLLYQWSSGGGDAIALERDGASGARFAVMAVGTSLFVGPPLAGDYVSAAATLDDFGRGAWPALPLVLVAALLQRRAFRGAAR